jgi:hypothetical protein
MKKTLLLFASLISLMLVSCTHYADGTSVWSGGLFILPLLTLAGAAIFGYQAYKAHNSGFTQQVPIKDETGKIIGGKTIEGDEKVPYFKIGQFWFSVALAVATIIIVVKVAFIDR